MTFKIKGLIKTLSLLLLLSSPLNSFADPVPAPTYVSDSKYRGWDYLVNKLREDGVKESDLELVYKSKRIPQFRFIPFKVAPKEHSSLYEGFLTKTGFKMCNKFIAEHEATLTIVQKKTGVPKEVIAAILYVESQFGKNPGKEMIIYRLSRISSVGEPLNVNWNYERILKEDPSVTVEALAERAEYLERTFRPEIVALLEIAHRNKVNIFNIKGSFAGAFGKPQFLPSTFLRFGFDGNKDGIVSLFSDNDAIWSIANFLGSFGFNSNITTEEKRAILWRYNKSDAYIDAILGIASAIG